jgi:4a-hydroxytetrahydrobiopterin dehydratase
MPILQESEIQAALGGLSGWAYVNGTLTKTFTLSSFPDAIALVNGIAEVAEEHSHHPDIDIRYNHVIVATSTHDAGNAVTEKDVALAQSIEAQAKFHAEHPTDES